MRLCTVEGCRILRVHLPSCVDPACLGCTPRLARDGWVCDRHWLSVSAGIRELPELFVALLTPTRTSSGGPRVSGTVEHREALLDHPRHARHEIRAGLAVWCHVLHDEYRIGLPADDVDSMARHVVRHVATLLRAEEHAGQLAHDVRVLVADGRRMAYPSRPVGTHIGDCPEQLPAEPGTEATVCGAGLRVLPGQEYVTCRRCGTTRAVNDWRALLLPETEKPMTGKDLRAFIRQRTGRTVTADQLRQWAHRGHVTRVSGGRGKAALYDPMTALIHVRHVDDTVMVVG